MAITTIMRGIILRMVSTYQVSLTEFVYSQTRKFTRKAMKVPTLSLIEVAVPK